MGSQTVLQLTAALSSASPRLGFRAQQRRTTANAAQRSFEARNCALNRGFNPLVNLPWKGTSRFSDTPRRSLQVAAWFGKKKPTVAVRDTVIPDPDYRLGTVLLGAAGAFVYSDNLFAAAPAGLLGLLLLFQATRVKFLFTDEALEVRIGEELSDSGENVFVGGENRWEYSSFINWEFWWPNFPVLVYFKTKPDQIHFFPIYFNGKQVYDVMVERCGLSKNSGPK